MNRIDQKFKELRKERRKAFIPFLTAGFPSLEATRRLVLELEANGADVIELGVPFSDPVADGIVIQNSSQEALKKGTSLKDVLNLVCSLRQKTEVPLAVMTYYNPILHFGALRFIKEAARVGLDAVIIPDLPPEEEKEFLRAARSAGIFVILFISPATSRKRAQFIIRQARGFIYCLSVTGVTGARGKISKALDKELRDLKRLAGSVPVCVGFGVSNPDQVRAMSRLCDGVIVGSAIIKKIYENKTQKDFIKRVGAFGKRLKKGLL